MIFKKKLLFQVIRIILIARNSEGFSNKYFSYIYIHYLTIISSRKNSLLYLGKTIWVIVFNNLYLNRLWVDFFEMYLLGYILKIFNKSRWDCNFLYYRNKRMYFEHDSVQVVWFVANSLAWRMYVYSCL